MRENFRPIPEKKSHKNKTLIFGGAIASMLGVGAVPEATMWQLAKSYDEPIQAPEQKSELGSLIRKIEIDPTKDAAIEEAIAIVQDNLKQPRVQKAKQGLDAYAVHTVVRAVELPINAHNLENTHYDPRYLHDRYPAQIWHYSDFSGELTWAIRASQPSSTRESYKQEGQAGYGNGFYFRDPYTFITNKHVAENILHDRSHETNYDVEILHVPERFKAKPEQVVDDEVLLDSEIEGKLVVIPSIDPDPTSDPNGRKTYTGVAFKISLDFARIAYTQDNLDFPIDMSIAYAVIIPPGEGALLDSKSEKKTSPASGTSGSAVWAWDKVSNTYKIAGIMGRAGVLRDGKRELSVAFFYPMSIVRSAVELQKPKELK